MCLMCVASSSFAFGRVFTLRARSATLVARDIVNVCVVLLLF